MHSVSIKIVLKVLILPQYFKNSEKVEKTIKKVLTYDLKRGILLFVS